MPDYRYELRRGEALVATGHLSREEPLRGRTADHDREPAGVVVLPGTRHRFSNAGDDEARFLCEIRPALDFESLVETMFTLAAEGKTGRHGLPGPLRLAVIARAHFDTVRLPFPPAPVQRAALAVGAPLGRALGHRATVDRPDGRGEVRPHRIYDRGRPHGARR